ncbi:hypothetical protein C9374_006566 [Naegleria lovaniensis]|uniref:DNA/RNA non-specific endonuclease domain-containing protein n=1 Tax=Naegleria lovaniensis TaxID=51637 RepID=A0AA88GHD7_NAELO|nr:uncharacterized protein C9374_006566 [Naegleria lovaniensis]KAG2379449.1 hypothetical protein C9374_006566 [Naegleria lovaniensis]
MPNNNKTINRSLFIAKFLLHWQLLLLLFFILVECLHAALPPSGTLHLRTQASQFPTSFKHISGSDGVLYTIVQPLLADCLSSGYQLYEVTNAAGSKSLYVSCYDATNHVPRFTINVLSYSELIQNNAKRPDQDPWFTVDSSDSTTGKTYDNPYDRGHLVANNDFRSEEEKKLTFIVINRAPQLAATNRGIWRHIEYSLRDALTQIGEQVPTLKALVITRLLFETSTTPRRAEFSVSSLYSQVPISYNKVAIVYDNSKIREVVTMSASNTDVTTLDQLPNIVKSWSSLGSSNPLKTNIQVTNVGTRSDVTTTLDTKVKNFKTFVDQCSAMKIPKTAYFLIDRDTTQRKWKVQVKNFSPCNHLCSFTMNQYIFVQSFFERDATTQFHMDVGLRSLFIDGVKDQTTRDFAFYLPHDQSISELSSMSTIEGIFTYTCEDKRKFTGAKHEFQNLGTRTTIKEQRLVSYGGVIAKKPRRNRDYLAATRRRTKPELSASDLKALLTKEYPPSTLSRSASTSSSSSSSSSTTTTVATPVTFTYTTFDVNHLTQFTVPPVSRGRTRERNSQTSQTSSSTRSRSKDNNQQQKHSSSVVQQLRGTSPMIISRSPSPSSRRNNPSPPPTRRGRTSSRSKSPERRSSPSPSSSSSYKRDRSRDHKNSSSRVVSKSNSKTSASSSTSSSSSASSKLSSGELVVKIEEQKTL